ncbi:MAG TPA: alpha/beta fold hydrolase BchO, partial [Burkholderiaceae bacterium]|nr:alpha/beta fold hydrolase BchO [Burkholderiaceae bacterium]
MSGRLSWPHDGARWPHREHSRLVQAGGLRWHVQVTEPPGAAAPTLLLLHGAGASTHSWRGLLPLLAADCRVIAPDLPGHAFSEPLPPQRQSLTGMAQALGELLRALEVEPDAAIGHSAGAALMLRMALDGPLGADAALIGLNAALFPFEGLPGLLYAPVARLFARSALVPRFAAWRAKDLDAVRRLIASTGSMLDDEGVGWYARLLQCPGHVAGVLA